MMAAAQWTADPQSRRSFTQSRQAPVAGTSLARHARALRRTRSWDDVQPRLS